MLVVFHGLKNLYIYDQLIKIFRFRGPYRRTLRTPSVRGIGKAPAALRAGTRAWRAGLSNSPRPSPALPACRQRLCLGPDAWKLAVSP